MSGRKMLIAMVVALAATVIVGPLRAAPVYPAAEMGGRDGYGESETTLRQHLLGILQNGMNPDNLPRSHPLSPLQGTPQTGIDDKG